MFFPFYYGGPGVLVLVLAAFAFSMWAQWRVHGTFRKYSEVRSRSGASGAEVARQILDRSGLPDVPVEHVGGNLTDHYDPRSRVLRLSDATYRSNSVAAIGVAAHEAGHAMQHQEGYVFLGARSLLYPLAAIGSQGGPLLFMLGLFFGWGRGPVSAFLMDLGIAIFAVAVLFYLITLPVEFDASARALRVLGGDAYLTETEVSGARAVLWAAAMTYVAAAAVAITELIRLLALRGSRRD